MNPQSANSSLVLVSDNSQTDNSPIVVIPDYSKDSLLTDFGIQTIKDRYLVDGETSPQDAFARASAAYADDQAHADRIYKYVSNLWFMFSSPIQSNGGTKRGLPISCFLNYVEDSREGITAHKTENAWLASMGGGIGGCWDGVRSKGQKTRHGSQTSGVNQFLHSIDGDILAFSQGKTRRGSYKASLSMSHPEIRAFMTIRRPGGDLNKKSLNLHHCVNIPDSFMEIIRMSLHDPDYDDSWPLIDPHTGEVTEIESARSLWQLLMDTRLETGEPFIHFIDTSNRLMNPFQKAKGMKIRQTNLCTEIIEVTETDRTAVCCLSSVNADKLDEWQDDPLFIEDIMRFLDNVLSAFIEESKSLPGDVLWRARRSAEAERSVGLGLMGFHSLLQRRGIPFESAMARGINNFLFKKLNRESLAASKKLALERGEPEDLQGSGERFANRLAIAPNATSSIMCGGVSPSTETIPANTYTHKTLSGSFQVENAHLKVVLDELGKNTPEVWTSIKDNEGSVQHLDFLDDHTKLVYKTSFEIDQRWVVQLAADRQKEICQSQSMNIFLYDPDVFQMTMLHVDMWEKGCKTAYYLRSKAVRRAENYAADLHVPPGEEPAVLKRDDYEGSICLGCEG